MSQPTRMALWTARLHNHQYQLQAVNAGEGEHRTKEFLAMNPNAVFPVLREESGFILHESNAICIYLCGEDSPFYPKKPQTRALVHQWLDWKHGALRQGCAGVVRRRVMAKLMKDPSKHSMSLVFKEVLPVREERQVQESLSILETALSSTGAYVVSGYDKPTLADLAIFEEVEQLRLLPAGQPLPEGSDIGKSFPQVAAWQERIRKLDGYEDIHKPLHATLKKLSAMRKNSKL